MPAFSSTRTTVIDAPPEAIRPLVTDFKEWVRWSPWEELDPELQRTYTGEGVGARYRWSGNKKAGQGSMTMRSMTPERIEVDLVFEKPFRANNEVVFELTPKGERTEVAWTMAGERNAAFALMGRLFFDRAIRKDFDKGLARLKAVAEAD